MAFDRNFATGTMLAMASNAYTVMDTPASNVTLPGGYTMAGLIEASAADAAEAMANGSPEHQRMAGQVVAESGTFGLVAWNGAARTAIVAIRGSRTLSDWIDNFDALPVPYLPVPAAGCVHMGFQIVHQHIRRSIARLLAGPCQGAASIWVTGHSLGGALAVLAAMEIAQQRPVPGVYTFAGPRAASPEFAHRFDALIPSCYRVVNFLDVVPQVPLPPLYEHVGTEVTVHGGFRPLNVAYAHRLPTYLLGLQKLAA